VIVASKVPKQPDQPIFLTSTNVSIALQINKVLENGGSPITNYKIYVDLGTEENSNY